MVIVARSRRVGRAVRLASRLDPNNCIDQRVARVRRRLRAKAGALDVAPVTPLLADVLDTRTALVNDEGRGEALLLENGSESLLNAIM